MKTEKNKERKLVVQSRTENLSRIRDFVYSAATEIGFPEEVKENIIVAVDEACTNIIKHAYKFLPDGEIIVTLKFSKNNFNIEILDYGTSFSPESVPDPDLQEYFRQKKVGGLGMFLMKKLMDEVKYTSIPGKYNRVLLSKHLNSNGHA